MKTAFTSQSNPSNEVYTIIAIPVETLQQLGNETLESLVGSQNVYFRPLTDFNINTQLAQTNTELDNANKAVLKTINDNSLEFIQDSKQLEHQNSQIQNLIISPKENANHLLEIQIPGVQKQRVLANDVLRTTVIEQNKNSNICDIKTQKSVISKPDTNNKKKYLRYLKWKPMNKKNRKKEKDSDSFKCPICGLVLNKMVVYKMHMEMHRNAKKYKCEQCSASYNVEENLKIHMAMHTKSEPMCPICDRKFQRLASLKSHIMLHEVDESFTCVECLAEYEKEEEFNKHMETHKLENVETPNQKLPLKCSICSHIFNDLSKYKEHISFHIKIKKLVLNAKKPRRRTTVNREYQHKCSVCSKTFAKLCLLERHVRIHSGEKPFACHLCKRAFTQKGTLQIHIARHNGIKPFQCTLCPAKFCQKGNLRAHVQKTHVIPGPGEKVYKCTLCTCIFKKVSSLNAHITRAHADDSQADDFTNLLDQLKVIENHLAPKTMDQKMPEESNLDIPKEDSHLKIDIAMKYVKLVDCSIEGTVRRYLVLQRKVGDYLWYVCSFCSKEFKKPSDLIRHIRVHTREKPFKCKECDMAFSLKSTLTTHSNTHEGVKPFECIICSKTFSSIRTLNVHKRRHEKPAKKNCSYVCTICSQIFSSLAKVKFHVESHKNAVTSGPAKKTIEIDPVMQQPMVETDNGLLPVPSIPSTKAGQTDSETSKPRPHKCQQCNSTFTKLVHLKRHLMIHSGERNYKCDMCSKSFYSSYALKDHLKFHVGERNFACKICGKSFITNAILKRHLLIHSSFRPYICPYCKKRFKTLILCRKHINTHKKDLVVDINAIQKITCDIPIKDDRMEIIDSKTGAITTFNKSLIANDCNLGNINLNNFGNMHSEEQLLLSNNVEVNVKSLQQKPPASKILYTDLENGIIISTPLDVQGEPGNDFSESLNPSLFQVNSAFINKTNLTPTLETVSSTNLDSVEEQMNRIHQDPLADTNDSSYPMIYINSTDLQSMASNNYYNSCLPQFKNNDPLLLNSLNEIQDSSTLFSTDPTLNQITDSQLESQHLDSLISTFTFNTNHLNAFATAFPNIILSNMEDNSELNQQLPSFANIEETTKVENNLITNGKTVEGDTTTLTLPEDAIIDLHQEHPVLTQFLYNGNQMDVDDNLPTNPDKENLEDSLESVDFKEENTPASNKNLPNSKFTCLVCKHDFKSVNLLSRHVCTKFQNLDIDFDLSRKPTKRKSKNNSKLKEALSGFQCNQCKLAFRTKAVLSKHLLAHKNKTSSPANCPFCDKNFKKRSDLERHIRTHTGEKPYTCNKCDKSFTLKSTLDSHYRTHNPSGNKEFNCAVCNSYFSSKSSLKVHMLKHTGVKPFQCPICFEKFRTSGHRKSHMIVHTNKGTTKKSQNKNAKINGLLASMTLDSENSRADDTNIQISNPQTVNEEVNKETTQNLTIQIDPTFIQQLQLNGIYLQDNIDNISSLMQLDLNNEGQVMDIKPVQVTGVKDINVNESLVERVTLDKSMEENPIPKSPVRNYQCDICNRKYITKSVLTKHRKIHSVKNWFVCKKCDVRYPTLKDLENHEKLHIGYRPFCCLLCANTFSEEKNLKTHMKRIHHATV